MGARAAGRAQWQLSTIVALLEDEQARLGELEVGDLAIRSCFRISYDGLRGAHGKPHTQEALRGIGALGARLVSVDIIARLLDIPRQSARVALECLVDAQLIDSVDAVRYRIHDLVRLFASEMAKEHPRLDDQGAGADAEDIVAGVGRVVSNLVTSAATAVRDLQRVDPRRNAQSTGFDDQEPTTPFDELALHNLIAVLSRATSDSTVHDNDAARAADAVFWFCHRRGYHNELRQIALISLAAAKRLGDKAAESAALHNLCLAHLRLLQPDRARDAAEAALELRIALHDKYGEGRTRDALGRALHLSGLSDEALAEEARALAIARELKDAYSESNVLCNMVPIYLALHRATEAVDSAKRSVQLRQTLGDPYGLARMGMSLAAAHAAVGEHNSAVREYLVSATAFETHSDMYDLARCLIRLADEYVASNEFDKAQECLHRVTAIRESTGDTIGKAEAMQRLEFLRSSNLPSPSPQSNAVRPEAP